MVDAQHRRFTFRHALGQGGFGEVYLAEMQAPSGLTSTVAVKVLHAGLDPASQAVMRLTDEGRILSMLNHPGIVAVHDLAIIEGRVALVTEFVEGADLPDCTTGDDPLPRGAIYEVFAAVADALHAAHQARDTSGKPLGLLHRDVKPRNVRVGRHGQVKLLDFGIATASGLSREAQTGTNALIGSFPYMAPERFKKGELGPASDIYSLGCSLYELLVGEKLFYQVDVAELLVPKTVPEANAPYLDERLALLTEVAPESRDLVRSLVDLDPAKRPDAPAIVQALEDLASDVGGVRLARWARAHDWAVIPGEPGTLTGRQIVETGSAPASSVPAPSDWSDEPLVTASAASTHIKRGLGAAALLGISGAVFAAVVAVTIGIALYLSTDGGPTAAPVEPVVPVSPAPPTPDAPDPVTPDDPNHPVAPDTPDPVPGTPDPTPAATDAPVDPQDPAQPVPDDGVADLGVAPVQPVVSPKDGASLQACGDPTALEVPAAAGRLTTTQRTCLSRTMRAASLKQVEKIRLGRLVLADAQARCKAGDCADYEREQPWYFEEVEQSDPDMMLAWASHVYKGGRASETRVWVRKALSRKDQWSGPTWVRRVDTLMQLDAMAAHDLWAANSRDDDLRNHAKEAAADWANHRARVKLDPTAAMELCVAAAGSAGPCNARVHDNAATSRVVVTTLPAGATLIVDGKAKGATPTEVDLSFGSHELKVTVGDRVGTRTITVGTEEPKRWTWDANKDTWASAF
ncbi:MAG: protein kinase [Myxococcales bacterium]|nr:protein kinase [Myxococcales bacterium]